MSDSSYLAMCSVVLLLDPFLSWKAVEMARSEKVHEHIDVDKAWGPSRSTSLALGTYV